MAEFSVSGPYGLEFEFLAGGRQFFWNDFWGKSGAIKAIASQRGVYLFAVRASKGYTPIYVGSATKTFKQECFNESNKRKLLEGLANYAKGSPVLFFVVHEKQKGKPSAKQIREIEDFFIGIASAKNPDLQNVKGVGKPKWSIRGVIRSAKGKPTQSAREFKRAIGYKG